MATQTLQQELIGLEKRYWEAIKNQDVKTAMSLTDDACIIAGAQGVAQIDRSRFASMMKAGHYTLHRFEIKDAVVRLLDVDTAIVAYQVHEDLTIDGQPVSLEAADASVWVRRDGHWVCTLHTESLKGDPFARDRGNVMH
jgi:ketosteroid isomerase-like protein